RQAGARRQDAPDEPGAGRESGAGGGDYERLGSGVGEGGTMFGPGKTVLEKDLQDWHGDCWSLLIRLGSRHRKVNYTKLILPTPQFFPKREAQGHARALHIFNAVKRLAGMEDWPTKLVPQDQVQREVGPMLHVQHRGRMCAGTFSQRDDHALIS